DKSLPLEESDDFFERQLQTAGNIYLARGEEAVPSNKFTKAARGVGSLVTHKDSDGVLRRIKPVEIDDQGTRIWHLGVLLAAHQLDLDLNAAEVSKSFLAIPDRAGHRHILPLDEDGLMLIDWSLAWNDPRILKLNFGMVVRMDL